MVPNVIVPKYNYDWPNDSIDRCDGKHVDEEEEILREGLKVVAWTSGSQIKRGILVDSVLVVDGDIFIIAVV